MTALLENRDSPRPHPRRPWWRFFFQFSLRTLLIAVTLAAIACWWFLQPKTADEELAGKYLRLRRHIRLEKRDAAKMYPAGMGDIIVVRNAGDWKLRDAHNDLLVTGRYDHDQPHGKWTTYHTSGHKAAEGEAFRGARNGLWTTWDDQGRLLEQATFDAREPPRLTSSLPYDPYWPPQPWQTIRHGPTRAWHPNGQLKLEGNYKNNLRHGPWIFYDDQGNVTSRLEYHEGANKSHTEAQGHREENR